MPSSLSLPLCATACLSIEHCTCVHQQPALLGGCCMLHSPCTAQQCRYSATVPHCPPPPHLRATGHPTSSGGTMEPEPEPEPSQAHQTVQKPNLCLPPKAARQVLSSWTHAGSCTDPACSCTDPTCAADAPAVTPVDTSATAVGATAQPAVCRHWWRKGSCLYGDSCKFGHPPHVTLAPWPRRSYRQQTYNAGRVGIFRRWLVDTFGLELLRSGGVLDVAGGHGKIAFELLNVHGIPSTVIDPRPLKLQRCLRMWGQGLWHKTGSKVHADALPPVRGQSEPALMPQHLRLFLEESLWQQGSTDTSDEGGVLAEAQDSWPDEQRRAFSRNLWRSSRVEWGSQGLSDTGHGEEEEAEAKAEAEATEPDALVARQRLEAEEHGAASLHPAYVEKEWAKTCELLSSASVAIGMHPDQAAGALVQFALDRGLPFAVVPCCVYSAEFPKRKLKDGRRVKSYEDLCDYLQEQAPGIERVVLPGLEGRNVCLFRIAPSK